jgi:MFS transporter, UMF1 family
MSVVTLNDKKTINGWAFFDWANSAYSLVISSAVFPAYFAEICPAEVHWAGMTFTSSSLLAYAVSIAYMFIVLVAPLLSGIADYGGKRKSFMQLFTYLGSIACILMYFFRHADDWHIGFWTYIIATVGFAGGLVFNNSFLPLIASADRYDAVSARGFTFGYLGSTLLLIMNLVMIQNYETFAFTDAGAASRFAFLMVGLWWAGFSLIPFSRLPQDSKAPLSKDVLSKGYEELLGVWKKVKQDANLKRFLLAFFFYDAGLQTIIFLAAVFAKKNLGFATADLIQLILLLQIVGALGAWLFSKLSNAIGNKLTLIAMLIIWVLICIAAFFVEAKMPFYILAIFLGTVMGGTQSLSRSTYSKLIPANTKDVTSYFSFFDITDKLAVVVGTLIFGYIDQMVNIRYSVLAMGVLFLIGVLFLATLKIKRKELVV